MRKRRGLSELEKHRDAKRRMFAHLREARYLLRQQKHGLAQAIEQLARLQEHAIPAYERAIPELEGQVEKLEKRIERNHPEGPNTAGKRELSSPSDSS